MVRTRCHHCCGLDSIPTRELRSHKLRGAANKIFYKIKKFKYTIINFIFPIPKIVYPHIILSKSEVQKISREKNHTKAYHAKAATISSAYFIYKEDFYRLLSIILSQLF